MSLSFIIFTSSIILIAICYQIYFEKVIAKRIPIKRKKKIFELLKNKYEGLIENDLGYLEYKIESKTVLFEYTSIRFRNSFSNNLNVHLDITNIEEDIKNLCKIHFYCSNIDNRDYIGIRVDIFYETLNRLARYSNKTVDKIISETDIYISQKRAERDNNLNKKYF